MQKRVELDSTSASFDSFDFNSLADARCLRDKLYHSAAEVEITADFEINMWLLNKRSEPEHDRLHKPSPRRAPGLSCVSNLTK